MHKKPASKPKLSRLSGWRQRIMQSRFARLHPALVPVLTFVALLLITVGGYVTFTHNHVEASDSRIVIVSYDRQQRTVPTREATVGALVDKLHIHIGDGDVVEPSPDTPINQDDFRINIYRAVPVEIVDGGHKQFTFSASTTSRSIALQTGAQVYPEDDLNTEPTTNFLADTAIGKRVVIERATPIAVNLYGSQIAMRTQAKTVGDLLAEKGITLKKGDSVTPKAITPVKKGMQVLVARKGTKLKVVTQEIPMPIKRISDPKLAYGTSAIRQQGSPGTRAMTYEIITKNGKEIGRRLVQTIVVERPVQQILVVGSNLGGIKGDMALAGISASDYNYADYVIEHESHWNPGAVNGSGCAGLGQACPGSKLAAACPNWANDPVCQLRFFTAYANSSHGGWAGAYQFKVSHGWW
jgi:uncharacterized protein YabE (DUF348 family)